ncbi:unnamed protein product [Pleuronectes platessa]|uniref:Uncharacterized protein n=1 Tax=Pleuronectes platessa TaxID=8262 RepID=A0A9N7UP62_PLEPL|nr:unnamed protein product [Pleuronectes platessa]
MISQEAAAVEDVHLFQAQTDHVLQEIKPPHSCVIKSEATRSHSDREERGGEEDGEEGMEKKLQSDGRLNCLQLRGRFHHPSIFLFPSSCTSFPSSLSYDLISVSFLTPLPSYHFLSVPLPVGTTSCQYHFLWVPLPVSTTSSQYHFLSVPLPVSTTSSQYHFLSVPLPVGTTSCRYHFLSGSSECISRLKEKRSSFLVHELNSLLLHLLPPPPPPPSSSSSSLLPSSSSSSSSSLLLSASSS